jgi:prevent-host-death family protein
MQIGGAPAPPFFVADGCSYIKIQLCLQGGGVMETVGVRDLKNQLSKHLKRVRQGHRLVITERGKAIATLEPVSAPAVPDWMMRLVREGKVRWSGGKPRGARTPRSAPDAKLSEAVIEDRADRV